MKLIALLFTLVFLTSCSHAILMKCTEPAPENVFRCDDKVDGQYRLCKPADDDYECEMPE